MAAGVDAVDERLDGRLNCMEPLARVAARRSFVRSLRVRVSVAVQRSRATANALEREVAREEAMGWWQ